MSGCGLLVCAAAMVAIEAALGMRGGASRTPAGTADGLVGGDGGGSPLGLVVLGDSTGAAVGASVFDRGYPRLVAATLAAAAGRPVSLHVLAVSGARVADVRHLQLPDVAALAPDIVLLVVGGNDVIHLTRARTVRADLRAVIRSCADSGAAVVVTGVPAMGTTIRVAQPLRSLIGLRAHRLDRIWREESSAAGAVRVQLARETGPAFAANHGLFSGDRFHPSDAGYALWARVLEGGVLRAYREGADDDRGERIAAPAGRAD
ncbi:MAG: SGNH/GDSL hydrolase family protein [Candidatus Dormibacteraeota bacterium]|uniref:SGNH/GDSL hydrolase family protein n=1 Tax=Candidatus Aeolococcus gillhamiae TaxID=3127015 RepID=A0A934N6R5_9BACT|nr:SGNH/GDSL hydrolase family protein [Candidatus Dormibacteraeota bacterium]